VFEDAESMMTHTHLTFCKDDLSRFLHIAPHQKKSLRSVAKFTWIKTIPSHNIYQGIDFNEGTSTENRGSLFGGLPPGTI